MDGMKQDDDGEMEMRSEKNDGELVAGRQLWREGKCGDWR